MYNANFKPYMYNANFKPPFNIQTISKKRILFIFLLIIIPPAPVSLPVSGNDIFFLLFSQFFFYFFKTCLVCLFLLSFLSVCADWQCSILVAKANHFWMWQDKG